jgi:hypothetical protein
MPVAIRKLPVGPDAVVLYGVMTTTVLRPGSTS